MKQITEDYVSFETAKLLKEKGFDEKCIGFYSMDGKFFGESAYRNNWKQEIHGSINTPTLQMAMKWLREVHKIIITIDFDEYELTSDNKKVGYGWNIQKIENPTEYFKISTMVYDTYEEACEAALKYTLENLI